MTVELVCWDSDAFLGWLQAEPGKAELCAGTLKRADLGEAIIFTSALTIAEVLWMRGAPTIPHDKADIVRRFFRRSYFRIRNVTRHIADDAQDLVWTQGIRPKETLSMLPQRWMHVRWPWRLSTLSFSRSREQSAIRRCSFGGLYLQLRDNSFDA
jgi:hypothetical protein